MAHHWHRYAVVAAVVTAAVLVVGVARSPVTSPPVPEPSKPAALPDVPLSQVRLAEVEPDRSAFCADISDESVIAAVGGSATATAYSPGERTTLEPGLVDVTHEFGCVFARGQAQARAWVFAAPVTEKAARRMVDKAKAARGCAETGELRFGDPGAVLSCTSKTERVVGGVGRIGDSWVHCDLSAPASEADPGLAQRAQWWCVAAVYAMRP